MSNLPIVLIGGGGHASVLADILLEQDRDIIAIISPENISQRAIFSGLRHLTKDDDILQFDTEDVLLVNGIGMMPRSLTKKKINEHFISLGYRFETVISKSAIISASAIIEEGAQILSAAIVQTGAKICPHSIVNTGALIEHDCVVGLYNHIAPRSTLCGEVTTGSGVFVGAGATVIQGIKLGHCSIVGAGVTVVHSLDKNMIAYPFRPLISNE